MVGMIEWADSDVCTLQGLDLTLAHTRHLYMYRAVDGSWPKRMRSSKMVKVNMERLVPKKASANAQMSESIAASCAWLVNALGCGAVYRTTGTPPSCRSNSSLSWSLALLARKTTLALCRAS